MDIQERIAHLDEAKTLIDEAIQHIKMAVAGTYLEPPVKAYVIPLLIRIATRDHQWLGSQTNLDDLIDALNE